MSAPFKIGDRVRYKNGGAPWLVIDVAVDWCRRPEMVIARREIIGVVEGVRPFGEYVLIDGAHP